MVSLEMLLCVILIFGSAYMSASEIALFSLSRFQLRYLKENFRPIYRKIKRLLSDPGGLLISILVVNEVLNIALSTLITEAVAKSGIAYSRWIPKQLSQMPHWALQTILGILITAPLLLFFCEITPKVIAIRMNQLVATLTSGTLTLIYRVLKPLRFILQFILKIISPMRTSPVKLVGAEKPPLSEKHEAILKESDFLLMLEEGHKEGAIQEGELELIRNVFELDNTPVSEISTPLSQVLTLSAQTTVKGALAAMRSQRYSRIPILGSNKKEVVGILYSKDLLRYRLQPDASATPVATLMRKPFFVTPSMKLNALFRKFKLHKIHMAIVKSPSGEATGIVTMSDILDTLLEDFFTEEEEFNPLAKKKPSSNNTRPISDTYPRVPSLRGKL